ncbi:MAG: cytochrome c oxidase subunit 3 [Phycisphaerales bacterium]|nr:cytochrome c oxidase subunit 3 [Phycisphaerales bacterium]
MTTTDRPATSAAGAGVRGAYRDERAQVIAGSFGLWALLATLAMLFGGLLLAILAIWASSEQWPKSLPPLPWQIWVSTASLIGCSIACSAAVAADRRGSVTGVRAAMASALIGAGIFTGMQVWAWFVWHDAVEQLLTDDGVHRLATTAFWVLTGLHVAHVLGGLIPLGMLVWYALWRRWTTVRRGLLGHTAIYWHFLDVVWLAMVLTMFIIL